MKKGTNRVKLAVGIIIICICHFHGKNLLGEKINWKGKVESNEGVKVIKNPEEPLFGELILNLDLELSIDDKKVKKEGFYRIEMVHVDYKDNIYVLDTKKCHILKLDRNGVFLNKMGRKGQGPGEFENPSFFFVDNKERIYVIDGRKIHIFGNSGDFLKTITMKYQLYNLFVDKDRNIIALSHVVREEGPEESILKFDLNGKLLKELVSFSSVKPVIRKDKNEKPVSLTVYHRYKYWTYLYPTNEESFVYAHSSQYKIIKMKSDGVKELIIENEFPPTPLKRRDKENVIKGIEERLRRMGKAFSRDIIEEACQFPPYIPFFDRIFVDDSGRIYVKRIKAETNGSKVFEFDIFGRDGIYLYKTKLPFTPAFLRNGYLYEIQSSEETGETRINKYKIKNLSEIKNFGMKSLE